VIELPLKGIPSQHPERPLVGHVTPSLLPGSAAHALFRAVYVVEERPVYS